MTRIKLTDAELNHIVDNILEVKRIGTYSGNLIHYQKRETRILAKLLPNQYKIWEKITSCWMNEGWGDHSLVKSGELEKCPECKFSREQMENLNKIFGKDDRS